MRRPQVESLKATAYHEAGHAVMAELLDIPFEHVTIVRKENGLGHLKYQRFPKWFRPDSAQWFRPDSASTRTRRRIESHIRICFAGGIAEKRFKGRRAPHWEAGLAEYLRAASRAIEASEAGELTPDSSEAVGLASRVCSSAKAAEHYLAWLYQETLEALDKSWYKALRAFERQTTEIVESLNNPAERLAFYGASQVWLAENQKALVLPAGKIHGASAGAPEPHAG